MTIEITRGKSETVYRINPYAPTEIDYRRNQHRARWFFYERYATPEAAAAAILELERKGKVSA